MKKRLGYLVFSTFLLTGSSLYAQENTSNEKRYFEINKNIEVFNSVVKELDMFYVDTIDVQKDDRIWYSKYVGRTRSLY